MQSGHNAVLLNKAKYADLFGGFKTSVLCQTQFFGKNVGNLTDF